MPEAGPQQKRRRVRTQLLVAVNVPLSLGLAVFLAWDYRREFVQAAEIKHSNLANEAVAIHRAIAHLLAERDEEGVQAYIDSVCHRMRAGGSEHHTIIVDSPSRTFFSHKSNRGVHAAIKAAKSAQVDYANDVLVVGTYSQPDLAVHVAESLTNARRNVRRLVIGRLAALAGLGLVAMVLVNTVVLQVVGRPIRKLVQTVDRIRAGQFDGPLHVFSTREFSKLADAIASMSNTLGNDRNRRQSQMEKAREIQQHLLPADTVVPGLRVAVWFEPAQRVAGDYYDVIPLADGSWLIALADVSGHGIPSALEAAILKVLLEHSAEQTSDPATILQLTNEKFVDLIPESHFATVFLARWLPAENLLEYANAGHIPGLFQNSDSPVKELEATGLLIGVDKLARCETRTIPVTGNERLLIVSDGVIERRSSSGALYGRARLTELFGEATADEPAALIHRLRRDLTSFATDDSAVDDMTALAVQFTV